MFTGIKGEFRNVIYKLQLCAVALPLTMRFLLLIENFYQYPARRHEILTAMQSLEVLSGTTINK